MAYTGCARPCLVASSPPGAEGLWAPAHRCDGPGSRGEGTTRAGVPAPRYFRGPWAHPALSAATVKGEKRELRDERHRPPRPPTPRAAAPRGAAIRRARWPDTPPSAQPAPPVLLRPTDTGCALRRRTAAAAVPLSRRLSLCATYISRACQLASIASSPAPSTAARRTVGTSTRPPPAHVCGLRAFLTRTFLTPHKKKPFTRKGKEERRRRVPEYRSRTARGTAE